MDKTPLVSVVIIFLNAERFLQEAIQSVLVQSYDAWELLLVDDGSTDKSTAIARQYAASYPWKIYYLEHEGQVNRGMSASRNLGINRAKGKYIAFLDADDVWLPHTLKEQVTILEVHTRAAMVYGPIQWWYSWTGNPDDSQRDYTEKLGVPSNTLIEPPTLLSLFLRNKAAVPSGILVRRKVIECIGGFEEIFRGEYEDQVFCAKICLNTPVFASGQCWYRYRQHADSCVSAGQRTGQTHPARLVFLNWLVKYLSDQRIKDRAVWWALRKEFWRCHHPILFRLLIRGQHLVRQMGRLLLS